MKNLKQKKNFVTRKMAIQDRQMLYEVSYRGNSTEHEIDYENLYRLKTTVRTNVRIWLIGGLVTMIVGLLYFSMQDSVPVEISIAILAISVFCFTMWQYTKQEFWHLKYDGTINVLIDKRIPSEPVVDDFLTGLYNTRDRYLIHEYGDVNFNLDYSSQLAVFSTLKKLEVFSEDEYEKRKELLDEHYTKQTRKIGFNRTLNQEDDT